MKFGVSSYSFSRLVREGKMKQTDVVRQAALMGFDFIEIVGSQKLDDNQSQDLRNESEKHGLPVLAYTFGADLLNGYEDAPATEEIGRIKKHIDCAFTLGASLVRHDIAYGPPAGVYLKSFYPYIPQLAGSIHEITEYAKEKGIRTTVENHGRFAQDSDRLEQLVIAVNNPNFGLCVDIGNFVCVGEDPSFAVGRLAPYAFHVHVKDIQLKPGDADPGRGWILAGPRGMQNLKCTIIGHGDIPVYTCLKALQCAGYQGGLSIEFEGIEEPLTGIEIGFENLRRYAARAGFTE